MQDSNNIIVTAADGYAKQLAHEYDVSLGRMYEILGKDNPYPKAIRLVTTIGRLNPSGLLLIQTDFNTRCQAVVDATPRITALASIHKEVSEALQAELDGQPLDERKRQLSEAIVALQNRWA